MLTATHIVENGSKIGSMARARTSTPTASNIQEVGLMAKRQESVATSGQMALGMKGNMTKANSTVKGS